MNSCNLTPSHPLKPILTVPPNYLVFSKDSFLQMPSLKRSPRARTNSRPHKFSSYRNTSGVCPSSTSKSRILHIIPELSEADHVEDDVEEYSVDVEEDDVLPPYPSSWRLAMPVTVPSSNPATSTRSRHSSAKSVVDSAVEIHNEARLSAYEFAIDDTLLLPPRSSPSPPASPSPSSLSPSNAIRPSSLSCGSTPSFAHPTSYPTHFNTSVSAGALPHSPNADTDFFFFATPTTPTAPVTPAYINALASPSSSGSYSDSFRLTFSESDLSLLFPHPPSHSRSYSPSSSPLSLPASHSSRQLQPHATSPTSSMSTTTSTSESSSGSPHSSPSSHTSELPATPTSSDDEFPLPPHTIPVSKNHPQRQHRQENNGHARMRRRRASIKPLFIAKPAGGMRTVVAVGSSPIILCTDADADDEQGGEGGVMQHVRSPYKLSKVEADKQQETENEDMDYDSLNDWYTEQLSDILTLYSPSPVSSLPTSHQSQPSSAAFPFTPFAFTPSSPTFAPARPDSILSLSPPLQWMEGAGEEEGAEVGGGKKKRESKPLPEIPALLMPSAQLDPSFPRRKQTVVSGCINSYSDFNSSSISDSKSNSNARPVSISRKSSLMKRKGGAEQCRPPSRTSVPIDLGIRTGEDNAWVDDANDEHEGKADEELVSQSSASIYSQDDSTSMPTPASVDLAEFKMESDVPLGLPLSLPTSPIDLESEFVSGLEQLALSKFLFQPRGARAGGRVDRGSIPIPKQEAVMEPAMPESPISNMYFPAPTPASVFASIPKALVRASSTPRSTHRSHNNKSNKDNEMQSQQNMDRVLRSRWSSSTLSGRRGHDQEQNITVGKTSGKEQMSTSSRLKFYFGSRSKKRQSKLPGSPSVMSPASPFFPFPAIPRSPTPRSPTPRSPTRYMLPPTPPPSKGFAGRPSSSSSRRQRDSMSTESSRTLRRSASRSSTNTNTSGHSDSGSCDSAGSSGLRRKPIPVDLLIKC